METNPVGSGAVLGGTIPVSPLFISVLCPGLLHPANPIKTRVITGKVFCQKADFFIWFLD
jgi:hypothetical protein